ncbi:MAG TPA: dCTP deaminase [Acidobacteriota bacterium]|jgi:dCTP deaminase
MILSDVQIREEIESGKLTISPYDKEMLQPASYDLKVGKDAATYPKNGDPKLDLQKEGFVVVAPFAPAIISTLEDLKIPLHLAGRFGLKSGLSRRGIYASVGPQIDPGFEGKLYVTLFNLTPGSLALNYGDSFLSLELHQLGTPASKGYTGEYQNRSTFSALEIESIMGYKGQGLTEVVQGFGEMREAIRSVGDLSRKFDSFLDDYDRQNRDAREFNKALLSEMKTLVEHIAGRSQRTVALRPIPREKAKEEIVTLFKNSNRTLFYSDVSEELELDLELVVELCNELENEGVIGVLNKYEAKRPEEKG